MLIEILVMTVHHVPFTRPYPPGHAKLKTRWPLYLVGFYAFAYLPVRIELATLGSLQSQAALIAAAATALLILVLASRGFSKNWSVRPDEGPIVDDDSIAVLDLSHPTVRRDPLDHPAHS
jgi:hypothetical protein